MTKEQIINLAKDAAASAFDAHLSENMPPASTALNFIIEMHCEELSEVEAEKFAKSCHFFDDDWILFVTTYKMRYAELALRAPGSN